MADVEVHAAHPAHGRIQSLEVRFKNAHAQTIDRDTAVRWLADGHSLVTYAGHGSHATRGRSIVLVEVGEDTFLRTDTAAEAEDHVAFPAGGH
jgi:hypothetical protein